MWISKIAAKRVFNCKEPIPLQPKTSNILPQICQKLATTLRTLSRVCEVGRAGSMSPPPELGSAREEAPGDVPAEPDLRVQPDERRPTPDASDASDVSFSA